MIDYTEKLAEALRRISTALECDEPCPPRYVRPCCGQDAGERFCAGCIARAALAAYEASKAPKAGTILIAKDEEDAYCDDGCERMDWHETCAPKADDKNFIFKDCTLVPAPAHPCTECGGTGVIFVSGDWPKRIDRPCLTCTSKSGGGA